MKKISRQKLRSIYRFILLLLGSTILGIGAGFFIGPYNIVTGGLTGVGIIFQTTLGWDLEIVVFILQVLTFFLGWIFLGKDMAIKTIVATIVYPITLALGGYLATLPGFYFSTEVGGFITVNYLLCAIFGGMLVGAGVGLTFLGGGSTGGVDIVVLILQKYTKLKTSTASFLIDGSIVILGFFLVNNNGIDRTFIGVISAAVTSMMIGKIFDTDQNVIVTIISKKYKELNQIILKKLDRGSTIIDATGGYSNQEVKMLQVVLGNREYYVLQEIVAREDPGAFMYTGRINSVRGEGFQAHKVIVPTLSEVDDLDEDTKAI